MGRRKGGWEGESCLRSCCGCDSRAVFRNVWVEATLSLWGRVSRRHLAVETRSCVFVQCKPCNLVNKFKPVFFRFLEEYCFKYILLNYMDDIYRCSPYRKGGVSFYIGILNCDCGEWEKCVIVIVVIYLLKYIVINLIGKGCLFLKNELRKHLFILKGTNKS